MARLLSYTNYYTSIQIRMEKRKRTLLEMSENFDNIDFLRSKLVKRKAVTHNLLGVLKNNLDWKDDSFIDERRSSRASIHNESGTNGQKSKRRMSIGAGSEVTSEIGIHILFILNHKVKKKMGQM